MGLFKKAFARGLQAHVDSVYDVEPWAGDAFPNGAVCAIGVPGEIEVDLPGGRYVFEYRVKGMPYGYRPNDGQPWSLPAIQTGIVPAADAARCTGVGIFDPAMSKGFINSFGTSKINMSWFDVPEPGGRYVVSAEGRAPDNEAHFHLKRD